MPPPLPQGFLCFALVFGALAQAAFWRFHSPTQVSAPHHTAKGTWARESPLHWGETVLGGTSSA